jgi:hypothetical protein
MMREWPFHEGKRVAFTPVEPIQGAETAMTQDTIAAWQEANLFTTEVRAAFRSLR